MRKYKLIIAGLSAAVVALSAALAYTATNIVPGTSLGFGSTTVSGYTVSSVSYTLNVTTPSNVDSVSFTISPSNPSSVKIQLASGGPFYACTVSGASITCATTSPQATASGITQLSVLAQG